MSANGVNVCRLAAGHAPEKINLCFLGSVFYAAIRVTTDMGFISLANIGAVLSGKKETHL